MRKDKLSVIKTLFYCAVNYARIFLNKNYLFIYRVKNRIKYQEVVFKDYNFKHLTGVKTHFSAKDFFSACKNRRLSETDITLQSTTFQKLAVLPMLQNIVCSPSLIGEYNNSGFNLDSDYLAGKELLSVGFRKDKMDYGVPNTLLKLSIKKVTVQAHKVLAVLSKKIDEPNYNSITYQAKGIELFELELPGILKNKIAPNLLITCDDQVDIALDEAAPTKST